MGLSAKGLATRGLAALAAAVVLCGGAQAKEVFSRPITLLVAGTAGGGLDLYARMIARHLGRHVPGNPSVVVQAMPGAGGIRAAGFMAEKAPRDGSTLATFAAGPLLEPLIGRRNPGYDMTQFNWIGAASRDVSVCIAWADSPFKSIEDARTREMVVTGTGAGSETDTLPALLNQVLGTRFKVVTGYLGTKESFMAVESGEAHGRCGLTWSSLKVAKPDWIRDNKIRVLLQLSARKSAELPDVPLVYDLIDKPDDRQLVELFTASTAILRPLAVPPGTSPARVEALRRAFDATMTDPALLDEGRRMQAEISPSTGEAVQAVIAKLYATPKPIVERAKAIGSTPP